MSKYNKFLSLVFLVLQLTDGLLTIWAVNNGYQEVNPLIVPIAGSLFYLSFKIVPAILAILFMDAVAKRDSKYNAAISAGLSLFNVFYVAVLISNLAEL